MITLTDCWAKTDPEMGKPILTVTDHCLIVGHVAKTLLASLPEPLQKVFPAGTITLIAAHDIGKLTPGFQLKCEKWKHFASLFAATHHDGLEKNHANVSQSHLQNVLKKPKTSSWLISTGGHHGRYPCGWKAKIAPSFEGENTTFLPLRNELLDIITGEFGSLPDSVVSSEDKSRVHLLTGFTIFADWIGSNTAWFPPTWKQEITAQDITLTTKKILRDLRFHTETKPKLTFGQLFNAKNPDQFPPRSLQSELLAAADTPGLYIVEAPMGSGKTEAALAASYQLWQTGQNHGLYFALPTQLTSERIHDRIHTFLEQITDADTVQTLIHGNAWLGDKKVRSLSPRPAHASHHPETEHNDTDEALRWFSTSRRQLLAPFGTGTIDQALLAILPARFAALRFFALAGKIIVIDEVHSYDPYTSELIDRLVKNLLKVGSTVIVLSATLTTKRRADLVAAAGATESNPPQAYPLITKVPTGIQQVQHLHENLHLDTSPLRVRLELETSSSLSPDILESIAEKIIAGANVVVIRNTVALAQKTFRELKSALTAAIPEKHIALIHSRFPQYKRHENEEKWMCLLGKHSRQRPEGSLLVSTQIVEQSVDIDADFLVTDLAPVDLLIQRIGRLHRHERPRPKGFENPTCLILHPEINWNSSPKEIETKLSPHRFIYPPLSLWQASTFLSKNHSLSLPDQIRDTLEAAHALQPSPESPVFQFLEDSKQADSNQRGTAKSRGIYAKTVNDIEGKETRYGIKPSGYLILLRAAPVINKDQVTLEFPHGDPVTIYPAQFSFPLARALHLNAIRIPRYLIMDTLKNNDAWLTLHMPDAILAIQQGDSKDLELPHAENPSHTFQYNHLHGLEYKKASPEASRYDSFEEDFIL